MVWPLIIGAALAGAGTGAKMYQQDRRRKAVAGAVGDYEAAADAESARNDAVAARDVEELGAMSDQDMDARARAIRGLLSTRDVSQRSVADYKTAAQPVIDQARAAAPVAQPAGGAGAQWASAAGRQQAPVLNRALNNQAREYFAVARDNEKDAVMADLAIRRLQAWRARADWKERQQIDKLIAQLAWQRHERQLQNRLNRASETGAEAMGYADLGTQAGGALMGMDQGAKK